MTRWSTLGPLAAAVLAGCASAPPERDPSESRAALLREAALAYCPDKVRPPVNYSIEGALLNRAGENVRPSAVSIRAAGIEPRACVVGCGSYVCHDVGPGVHTVTATFGSRTYERQVMPPFDGCGVGSSTRADFVADANIDAESCGDKSLGFLSFSN